MQRFASYAAALFGGIALLLPFSASATTVFLTSGTSWTVPSDWNNANNKIEVIGGGGGGGFFDGAGGGGGAYAKISNAALTPGASVAYSVGSAGAGSTSGTNGISGGDSFFCNSLSNCSGINDTAVIVGSKGGGGGADFANTNVPTSGGLAASSIGTLKYSGGGSPGSNSTGAGGGGGAAGPNGAGSDGQAGFGPWHGGDGGRGDATSGGLGGAGAAPGGNGSAGGGGTEFDASHGAGGGGGGSGDSGGVTEIGGVGGAYGGGGGGGVLAGGNGSPGIIVINYTPAGRIIRLRGHIRLKGNIRLAGVTPVRQCAGTSYGGYCWYFSPASASCTTACATHGSCNLAGITAYGSSGNEAMCTALLTAMGAPAPGYAFLDGATTGGNGCMSVDWGTGVQYWRDTDATSCSADNSANDSFLGASTYRACSCTN